MAVVTCTNKALPRRQIHRFYCRDVAPFQGNGEYVNSANCRSELMKITFLLIAFCSGFLATLVVAQPFGNTDEQRADVQRDMARALAPIKSAETLRAYQSITPDAVSPLAKLSVKGRAEFLASLVFGEQGLAGFSTRVWKMN
jgi:hypothetical protein